MRLSPLIAAVVLSGCASQAELDQVTAERDQLAAKVTELEGQTVSLGKERDRLSRQVAKLSKEEAAKQAALSARGDKAVEVRKEIGVGATDALAATFHTTAGDIRCDLYVDQAPVTVLNFVQLAEGTKEWTTPQGEKVTKPLYNGTPFHRVIPNFMIQGGDPAGNGSGGPGFTFEDEFDPELRFDKPGQLAMANRGPRTNGSQFFITDSAPKHLNDKHTIFGQCGNLDVVKTIINAPAVRTKPNEPVLLNSVEIHRG